MLRVQLLTIFVHRGLETEGTKIRISPKSNWKLWCDPA